MTDSPSDYSNKLTALISSRERPPQTLSEIERDVLAFDLQQRAHLTSLRVECGSGIEVPAVVEPPAKKPKKKRRKKKAEHPAVDKPLTNKQKELFEKVKKQKAKKQNKNKKGGKAK